MKMKIKKFFQKLPYVNKKYTEIKWRERHIRLGKENPDKIFYVIRRATCKVGLFSHVMTNIGHIKYAIDHDYIPVIDMQNNGNTYLEESELGKKNAWEFYFKQPCGYSLTDISKSKNIILSDGLLKGRVDIPDAHMVYDESKLAMWKDITDRYVKVLDKIMKEVEERKKEIFGDSRVLGVLARGTDYVKSKPRKHPIQPETSQIIAKSKELMEEYQCDRIYLATEDLQIFHEFATAFGDKLVSMEVKRYQAEKDENINDLMRFDQEKNVYLKGKEYLESILLLSKCNCLVAGNAGGTQGALLFSKGYEHRYVFDLGEY